MNRSFHAPTNQCCQELQCLDEIDYLISADRQEIKSMNFNQAKKLLEKYVGDEIIREIESPYQIPQYY